MAEAKASAARGRERIDAIKNESSLQIKALPFGNTKKTSPRLDNASATLSRVPSVSLSQRHTSSAKLATANPLMTARIGQKAISRLGNRNGASKYAAAQPMETTTSARSHGCRAIVRITCPGPIFIHRHFRYSAIRPYR